MPTNVHPSLDEIDWLLANPDEAPNPPLLWISWPDWWEKILAPNRTGFIEFHLWHEPEGDFLIQEYCDGELGFARLVPTCREALATFADRLDGGLPRGDLVAFNGPENLFVLFRRDKVWFYWTRQGDERRTRKAGTFKRGLLALAHWAANLGLMSDHLGVIARKSKPNK